MINLVIGEKISKFRRERGMTIKEMAQMTGLSSALLSQLERNIGNPTLSALSAIAHTLNVPLSDLVQERVENKELILRKNERRRVAYIKNSEEMYDVLSKETAHSNLELLSMTLEAHCKASSGFNCHPNAEEIALVTSGQACILFLENGQVEEFILDEGDSIRILPGRYHMTENRSDQETQIIFVKYRH